MSSAVVSSELPDKVNTEALRAVLDGRWAWVRADVRAQLGQRRLHRPLARLGLPWLSRPWLGSRSKSEDDADEKRAGARGPVGRSV